MTRRRSRRARDGPAGTVRLVAVNGSPHRDGNTATLLQWVVEGCLEEGARVDWVRLADHEIRYCQGCFSCLRTGACPLPDDFGRVRDVLVSAEGLIVGSPVYEAQPTAQMKALLDRLALLALYTRTFERHHAVGVATSGVAPTRGVARGLASFFGRRVGTIGAKTTTLARGHQSLSQAHDPRLPGRARALGRRLVRRIRRERCIPFPTPRDLWFRVLERAVVRPLVLRHPDDFAGVIEAWRAEGRLPPKGREKGRRGGRP